MIRYAVAAAALLAAAPAFADGDAAKGETGFKKCVACHVVADAGGNLLAGKAGKVGPNLYGLMGRTAGTVEGFRYKPSLVAAGEKGLVWNEEEVAKYLLDPSKYLQAYLEDPKARSGMALKARNEEEAEDIAAYLATFAAQ